MVEDAGVKLYLHSWGTKAIMEDNTVKGVIFESKSGRKAILGKVVIDATGDGDLLPSAGAESTSKMDVHLRIRNLALVFNIGGVDSRKFDDTHSSDPAGYAEMVRTVYQLNGFVVGSTKWASGKALRGSTISCRDGAVPE